MPVYLPPCIGSDRNRGSDIMKLRQLEAPEYCRKRIPLAETVRVQFPHVDLRLVLDVLTEHLWVVAAGSHVSARPVPRP